MYGRQIHFLILLTGMAVMILSCSGGNDLTEQNKAIILQAMNAQNNHKYNKLNQFFAEDFLRHCQATPDVQINSLEKMIRFIKQ